MNRRPDLWRDSMNMNLNIANVTDAQLDMMIVRLRLASNSDGDE
jgi:hypothetical protein